MKIKIHNPEQGNFEFVLYTKNFTFIAVIFWIFQTFFLIGKSTFKQPYSAQGSLGAL